MRRRQPTTAPCGTGSRTSISTVRARGTDQSWRRAARRASGDEPGLVPDACPVVQFPVKIEVGQLPAVFLEVLALEWQQVRLDQADDRELDWRSAGKIHRL